MRVFVPTSVEASLLRDVLEHPRELRYRLVLADWWEEHGQEERAEFVRVQCAFESARGDESPPNPAADLRLLELAQRERELRGTVGRHVMGDLRLHMGGYIWMLRPNDSDYPDLPGLTFCRGFVEDVTLPCDDFLARARALFSAQPVLRVTLSDREPYEDHPRDASGRFVPAPAPWCYYWSGLRPGQNWQDWHGHRPDLLPAPLYAACVAFSFDSREEALAALSDACVAWGRAEADLPPLPG